MDELESSSLPEGSLGSNLIQEKHEKQREAYKKAQSQLQKSKKDEKKAKGDNDDLFLILQRFIQNPYYESLIPTITELLQVTLPSRFIFGITALIYPESALYVLTKLEKKEQIQGLLNLYHYPTKIQFNEHTLHSTIRQWMSQWVQFSTNYLVYPDVSEILEQKLLDFIYMDERRKLMKTALNRFIQFFFISRNIDIPQNTTDGYAEFILKEYKKTLEIALEKADKDLTTPVFSEPTNLFGLG